MDTNKAEEEMPIPYTNVNSKHAAFTKNFLQQAMSVTQPCAIAAAAVAKEMSKRVTYRIPRSESGMNIQERVVLEIKRHHIVDPSTAGVDPRVSSLLFLLLEISNGWMELMPMGVTLTQPCR